MSQRLLPAIGNCTGLRELQLGSADGGCYGMNFEGGTIKDAQFAALVGLRRLESLELSNIIRLSGAVQAVAYFHKTSIAARASISSSYPEGSPPPWREPANSVV